MGRTRHRDIQEALFCGLSPCVHLREFSCQRDWISDGRARQGSGEVVSVGHFTPMRGMHHGVHMMVKTDKETVSVHLGPVWYIENQDVKIEPKERVEVKGSRIDLAGEQAIIASEVRKGDQVLKLRDEDGFPAWSGWRRR